MVSPGRWCLIGGFILLQRSVETPYLQGGQYIKHSYMSYILYLCVDMKESHIMSAIGNNPYHLVIALILNLCDSSSLKKTMQRLHKYLYHIFWHSKGYQIKLSTMIIVNHTLIIVLFMYCFTSWMYGTMCHFQLWS